MLISKADIDELKRRHELSVFVSSSGVELKKKGTYFVGRCPFHTPDKTPSLVVDPRKQIWNCLGACRSNGNAGGGKGSSGGDLFAFAMKLWGVDFRETFKRLGGEVRNEIPPPRRKTSNPTEGTPRPTIAAAAMTPTSRAPRTELFSRVVEHFANELAQQRPAQEYLEARGLRTRALWRAFKLGYSSGSLEELAGTDERSETRRLLLDLGILMRIEPEDSAQLPRVRERMKGRIVFPLFAFNQLPVGLYGRAIDDALDPHHMFLPGPRRGLFNWNAARSRKEILVVESVIDALSLVEAGVGHVIPLYGTNGLTDDHKELIRRCGVTSVVVALDADEAGRKATPALVAAFEALGAKARAIEWPEKDPNELLVKYGPQKTREIVMSLLAPAAVREAVNSLSLVAGSAVEDVPVESAVKEEKSQGPDLLGEVLTLTSGDRLWRVVWTQGCSPSHLRATARVRLGDKADAPSFLDALDLVSARARESFARRAASTSATALEDEARLSLQRALEADLLKIADLGEERRRTIETRGAVPLSISEEEKRQALAFLSDPELLSRIASDIEALGYVGEDTNKKIGYLVAVSRKLDAALSMVILSTSGSGKSGLAEALEALTPEEDLLSISRLSPQALYYMPKDALRRKFVSIEERAGSVEADYSIRSLQSKKKLTLAVPIKDPSTGKIETKIFEILGPAAFLETTTESEINVENATRCFEVHLDESTQQTRRIQEAQRRAKTVEGQRSRATRHQLIALHKNAQRLLKALPVVIPYAEAIEFPSAWIRTRRDNLRFLHLIEVLAFLHQYQRPLLDVKTGERMNVMNVRLEEIVEGEVETLAIEATLDDYAAAYALSKELLADTFEDLSRPARELYEGIRSHAESVAKDKSIDPRQVVFTRREIRETSRLPNYRIKTLFRELEELEYLVVTRGSRGATSAYQLVEAGADERARVLGLLSPEELGRKLAHETAVRR